jgi:hypothetical protein
LEQNILRFPQSKSSSGVYGSAIHKALEEGQVYTTKNKKIPPLPTLITVFKKELKYGRLLQHEEEKLSLRGEKVLERYYALAKESFLGKVTVEANFTNEGVVIDGAHITGKIDKMIDHGDKIVSVVDLKTGKGFSSFEDSKLTPYDEIKLHHYRHQLLFYKLLIENSRSYEGYHVEDGSLEFVEEEVENMVLSLSLSFDGIKEEERRLRDLIAIVYKKIMMLDFPDVSGYEKNLEGIKKFEEDLLLGRV